MVSTYYCTTNSITCSRVLNSSPGRLDLGGLGFKSPGPLDIARHVIPRTLIPRLFCGTL